MPRYAWRNVKTGEIREVVRSIDEHDIPPTKSGKWERIYSVAIGSVSGAGGSPSRPSGGK